MEKQQTGPALRRSGLAADPAVQFARWYTEAAAVETGFTDAMALATASAAGRPSVRMVLLKGFDREGFRFFTNYESRKGVELLENPYAALMFYWHVSGRQVRIEGRCSRLPLAASDEYFAERPLGSQLGARVSRQSRMLPDREALEEALQEETARFPKKPVPRPDYWGGFQLKPDAFEFWQARENRLHDRFRYRLSGRQWQIDRLAP